MTGEHKVTVEELERAKKELDACLKVATDFTDRSGRRCQVNGLSQFNAAIISLWLEECLQVSA